MPLNNCISFFNFFYLTILYKGVSLSFQSVKLGCFRQLKSLGEAVWHTGFPPSRFHHLAFFMRTVSKPAFIGRVSIGSWLFIYLVPLAHKIITKSDEQKNRNKTRYTAINKSYLWGNVLPQESGYKTCW